MKIRTITVGFNLNPESMENRVRKLGEFLQRARSAFKARGYSVQTVRIATQPWGKYYASRLQMLALARKLDKLTESAGIDYFNLGTTFKPDRILMTYDFIKETSRGFCTTTVCDGKKINLEAAEQTVQVMRKLSRVDPNGFSNLRFAALFNTEPGSPFYPAAYNRGRTSFAIGLENSDLVGKAFSEARSLNDASHCLKRVMTRAYRRVEQIAESVSRDSGFPYDGIDVSVASSVEPGESIAAGFEKLGLGRFGDPGTLTAAKVVTDTLRRLPVKRCGYSGLMLPVLEDHGLAQRNSEGCFGLTELLLYSAVCGTGLDTIPLPGDVSEKKLYALLLDIASLAVKLNKPLSARLMPVPGKKAGQMTSFDFDYFINTHIMRI